MGCGEGTNGEGEAVSWERLCLGEAAALLPWFQDSAVTDLLVNGTEGLFVEKGGELEAAVNPFSESGLRGFVERLLLPLGKSLDATQPYVDGRIGDVVRFHAVFAPAVSGGPHLSFRFSRKADRASLASFGAVELLVDGLARGENWVLAGATGSGKTTLLCRLVETLPIAERIVVVEESREIRVDHPHVVHLEGRAAGPDGFGAISLRSLVRQSLRMRPDRLVLGECRGEEAFDLIQALNTGHGGSLTTLHANSCRDALRRLESLILLGCSGAGVGTVREWVAGAVQGVAFLERCGNQRRIAELMEVAGLEGEVYRITPKSVREPRSGSPLAPDRKVCEFTPLCR